MKILFLALLLVSDLFAQNSIKIDTVGARKKIIKADSCASQGKYTDAIDLLNTASAVYQKYKLTNLHYEADIKLADYENRNGNFDKAIEIASAALKQEISEKQKIYFHNSMGFAQLNKGRGDLALIEFEMALSLIKIQNSLESALTFNHLGLSFWNAGNSDLALEYYLKALNIYREKLGEASLKVASIYNNIGLLYVANEPEKALDYYQKSLKAYQKIFGNQLTPAVAIAFNNIGIVLKKLTKYNEALDNFEKTLSIYQKIYSTDHPNIGFTYSTIAQVFVAKNSGKKAIEYYEKALAIYKNKFGDKHPEIANTYNLLGSYYLNESNYKLALACFQSALIANSPTFTTSNLYQNPNAGDYYNSNLLLTSLDLKAQALEKMHFAKSLKRKDLLLAFQTLKICDTLVDKIRQSRTSKADKIALGSIASDIYDSGIKISLDLADVSLDKQKYLKQAFYFNEKNKASVLLEAISDANAKQFAGIPDSLVEKEKKLKADLALIEQKIADKPEPKQEKIYRDQLFTINRSLEKFSKQLGKDYPEYYNLKFSVSIATVEDVQRTIDDKSALLSYFVSEKLNAIYLFDIRKNSFSVNNIAKQDLYEKRLIALRNSLKFHSKDVFLQNSLLLKKQLFPYAFPAKIKQLILIPDGKMGTIPFEALIEKMPSNKEDFLQTTFMLKKFAMSYSYSSTLFVQTLQKKSFGATKNIFLVAPVNFSNTKTNETLVELPGTEQEIDKIEAICATSSIVAKKLLRDSATEKEVKSIDLTGFKYLHFATHGLVNETHPELSEIFLQIDGGKKEDGNLYSGEIYNLKLKADLVTLSACQTGLGKIAKGEGMIGLTRALFYAGAKNIIVSLWSVSDASTSSLMIDLYSYIAKSKTDDYAMALRSAKLKLLEDPIFSDPYYWAPFVLVGK